MQADEQQGHEQFGKCKVGKWASKQVDNRACQGANSYFLTPCNRKQLKYACVGQVGRQKARGQA